MKVVIQRVESAQVHVAGHVVGAIDKGLLLLLGFGLDESQHDMEWLIQKVLNLRIFNDAEGVMNLNVKEIGGSLLLVSQFTLMAQTKKGNRPSYLKAAPPEQARVYYQTFVNLFKSKTEIKIEQGEFGADMKVCLVNDGPVTIQIDSQARD